VLHGLLEMRAEKYLIFMASIQRLIAHILFEDSQMRAQLAVISWQLKSSKFRVQPLIYINSVNAFHLIFQPLVSLPRVTFVCNPQSIGCVYNFLKTLRVANRPDNHIYITWIEFYILFVLRGGPLCMTSCTAPHRHLQTTIKKPLCLFKHIVRALVRSFLQTDKTKLFTSPPIAVRRLRAIGYTNNLAKLNMTVSIDPDEAHQLALVLLSSGPSAGHRLNCLETVLLMLRLPSFSFVTN
jgi:hypothetical protein